MIHYGIAPRKAEILIGNVEKTIDFLERIPKILIRKTEDSDELIPMSNISGKSSNIVQSLSQI
jgi:hypothetical protein